MSLKSDLLGVQAAARCLNMIFELLRALVTTIFVFDGLGPDTTCDSTYHRVLWVQTIGKKERKVGGKIVDLHSPGQVVLHKREAVGQGKRQLRNGIRPRFRNMVAGNRHGIEIPHVVLDEILLNVPHHPQGEFRGEDAGVFGPDPLLRCRPERSHERRTSCQP